MAFFNDKLTDGRGNSRLMIIARERDAPIEKLILLVDICASRKNCEIAKAAGGSRGPRTTTGATSSRSIDSRLQGKEERCSSGSREAGMG